MEGSVLSFIKAEWKVSDTGSAHWASSYWNSPFLNNVIIKSYAAFLYAMVTIADLFGIPA